MIGGERRKRRNRLKYQLTVASHIGRCPYVVRRRDPLIVGRRRLDATVRRWSLEKIGHFIFKKGFDLSRTKTKTEIKRSFLLFKIDQFVTLLVQLDARSRIFPCGGAGSVPVVVLAAGKESVLEWGTMNSSDVKEVTAAPTGPPQPLE
ncbi:unnamed protein product [Fraxinus pennsylvanica]|uniref:Uncharacterized protein n=1 Tax=Fraxinus pennsylvanica TaxID=56036 RepID=A0AAD2EAP8_9LAMI|nr:unnamed protein product [Fraxinus pennsylvanica]